MNRWPCAREARAVMCMNGNLIVRLTLLFLLQPLVGVAQVLPLDEYIDAGCYTGESIALEPGNQFTRLSWDDTTIRFETPEPWTYRIGERGTYTISEDSVRLTFKEIVFDSTAIVDEHGSNPRWTESPDDYATQAVAEMNQDSWVLLVKSVGGRQVLWNPTETADLSECRRMIEANPDTLRAACYTPECAGVLWPKRLQ